MFFYRDMSRKRLIQTPIMSMTISDSLESDRSRRNKTLVKHLQINGSGEKNKCADSPACSRL